MIYVGINVAKDKHDCFISNSEGEILFKTSILDNRKRFETLFQKNASVSDYLAKAKVELEATGHYNCNLLCFLISKGLSTYVIIIAEIGFFNRFDSPDKILA